MAVGYERASPRCACYDAFKSSKQFLKVLMDYMQPTDWNRNHVVSDIQGMITMPFLFLLIYSILIGKLYCKILALDFNYLHSAMLLKLYLLA